MQLYMVVLKAVVAELIQKCNEESARYAIDQEDCQKRYEALVERFDKAKVWLEEVTAQTSDKKARGENSISSLPTSKGRTGLSSSLTSGSSAALWTSPRFTAKTTCGSLSRTALRKGVISRIGKPLGSGCSGRTLFLCSFRFIYLRRNKISFDLYAGLDYNRSIIVKGGKMMTLPIELKKIIQQNSGTITTAQANEVGISNERLRLLVKSGELEKASFGVYILPDEFVDRMYIAQLRRPKIIYSHETALFLHDLTDRDPISYTVTVPTGYNTVKLREDGFTVFTIKRDLHEVGTTHLTTMFGHTVVAYGLERTICDVLRSRNQMDISVVTDAVKRYAGRKDKNLNTLMKMAEIFGVTKPLRSYMEVLL